VSTSRFVTVTLSPCLNRTLVLHYLALGHQNLSQEPEQLAPSGEGLSVARALTQLECQTYAIVLLGNDATAAAYRALLAEEGMEYQIITVDGSTTSDTCILDRGEEQETHIGAEGSPLTETDLERVRDAVQRTVLPEDRVVLAGRIPPGAPPEMYARLLSDIHRAGADSVVAASGAALDAALVARPGLVALSRLHCEALLNIPIRVTQDLIGAADELRERGAESVLLEMREKGSALLVTGEGRWKVDLPDAAHGSTTGVWEALLAGFLAGQCHQRPLEESLEMAAAAAAYTADEAGVEFGSPSDVKEYRADVEVLRFKEDQEPKGPMPGQGPGEPSRERVANADRKGGAD
jgi:1-phosphofructokinase family hexose kinase